MKRAGYFSSFQPENHAGAREFPSGLIALGHRFYQANFGPPASFRRGLMAFVRGGAAGRA